MTTPVPVPVHLPDPRPLPAAEPAPGCGVCAALVKQRAEALAAGDQSKALDLSIEIRNHPHNPGSDA
ncbi:hypothetical protein [Streptomyces sp. MUM 178J]|uniref:hypothetical protein n=1 Tax=Streptomyces sp. MUM 178J TaxID=2791991 RepID=UPI001F03558D|nr:hypothetical protein [Streptomyces sp. MUM 178J]WRQ81162.1 hypothetical protein I3F59_018425 [Streptomyces sp. MUM 178J]